MKAYTLTSPDGPDGLRLADVEMPRPGPGEVLIEVRALSLNPVDFKTAHGKALYGSLREEDPIILGWDVAGRIKEVGEGAGKFVAGQDVFGMVNFPGHGKAYAQYVTAPVSQLVLKPETIDFHEAAAATLAALTAWQNLIEIADIKAGQRVLIHAAGGGVGHFAIQLAKERGAYVIGTGSRSKQDFIRELGADEAINYEEVDFEDILSPVDVVLDSLGPEHLNRSLTVVKPGGKLLTIAAGLSDSLKERAEFKSVELHHHLVQSSGANMEEIASRLADDRLKAHVSKTYAFANLPAALRELEGGSTRGKLIVTLDQ
ncbi:NADPH:quinone reductase-like Zn-dependent oxidoreductase [Neolewinella xylanilytica]|uniref:NADPH:quinone reductase-like Zn-dependent oxidoreductase n=1 Tax=Neolewinella xylanilytica TaxID=1514080 RepID=A0A2S6I2L7_9BACT|nr:NADP-dependent oxidoreductase [Neolewinella xylanilytica]PPK85426.1 NADPH:quinone reductase-like Zn-dependent oxidoreductase [Neolewinella xylanilytica]